MTKSLGSQSQVKIQTKAGMIQDGEGKPSLYFKISFIYVLLVKTFTCMGKENELKTIFSEINTQDRVQVQMAIISRQFHVNTENVSRLHIKHFVKKIQKNYRIMMN